MPKNTYNNLKLALEEKGYWTPLDERRTDKDVVVESVRKEQERERVFSFIRDFVATHVPDGGCPFGKMNSEECLDVRDGQCEICIIDHATESLRGQHGKKD